MIIAFEISIKLVQLVDVFFSMIINKLILSVQLLVDDLKLTHFLLNFNYEKVMQIY
jgi:hypothetical protein